MIVITSNADILHSESTAADLVDSYLPDIFDAVDLYIDTSADNASSSNSSEVQEALYNIGERSVALIANLEATITVTVDDESSILCDFVECRSCFVWEYKADGESEWRWFEVAENDDVSMSITRSGDEYSSHLVVQSICRLNAGH